MQIVCPHCSTSYEVNSTALGPEGRSVRCARCKEVWHAMPESSFAATADESYAEPSADAWDAAAGDGWEEASQAPTDEAAHTPMVESPPIADDGFAADAPSALEHAIDHDFGDVTDQPPRRTLSFGRKGYDKARVAALLPAWLDLTRFLPAKFRPNLGAVTIGMATLAVGLLVWRAEVVRAMPQTAAFFKVLGFGVNLRGLEFANVRVTTEAVNGAQVFVIEGDVVNITRKPLELPRLRFAVRDSKGHEVHAWNAVLEQPALGVNEKVAFRSRLATPPPDAREITARFFHRRDVGSGNS